MHRVAVGKRHPALVVDIADGAVDIQQFWNGCPEPKVPEAICRRFRSSSVKVRLATKRGFDARSQ